MVSRAPINPSRVRRISGSFSWLDHRLLTDGFLAAMEADEMLLYFFLVLVGDRNGISFYSYDKICTLLKLDLERFLRARDQLVRRSLLAYEDGRYQVLQLPERRGQATDAERRAPPEPSRGGDFNALAKIFQNLATPQS